MKRAPWVLVTGDRALSGGLRQPPTGRVVTTTVTRDAGAPSADVTGVDFRTPSTNHWRIGPGSRRSTAVAIHLSIPPSRIPAGPTGVRRLDRTPGYHKNAEDHRCAEQSLRACC